MNEPLGFRVHEGIRCQGHYRELTLRSEGSSSRCESECSEDIECFAFSTEQTKSSGTSLCFLFADKSSCVPSQGWESGFKGACCEVLVIP
jgi:hypothetical protein